MQKTKIISADVGIKNTGLSLLELTESKQLKILDMQLIGTDFDHNNKLNNDQNLIIKNMSKKFMDFKMSICSKYNINEFILIIEQQPHINRKSCMIHDILSAIFYDVDQLNLHPSKKNQVQLVTKDNILINIETCGGAKPQKTLSKKITDYIVNLDMNQDFKIIWQGFSKKDDVSDSILQALYYTTNIIC